YDFQIDGTPNRIHVKKGIRIILCLIYLHTFYNTSKESPKSYLAFSSPFSATNTTSTVE
uniref:Uncharacterized protein n=1 Tax=Amphimedon queenslandica TaxID=400682 RepID=A0A1X7U0L5_AMPQE